MYEVVENERPLQTTTEVGHAHFQSAITRRCLGEI